MAYSKRINDPAFDKYLADRARYAKLFASILAAAAIGGFALYGEFGGDMENPEALYIGLAIGGMFLAIAWLTNRSRKGRPSWDGTVIDKRVEKKTRNRKAEDMDYHRREYLLYTVVIQADNGKRHEITAEDDDTLYNYYRVRERVRFHGKLGSCEKEDKSADTIIFCSACASLNEISEDRCHRCHCPLLK